MKLHSDLPVYKSTYDLLLGIFEFTKSFSKEYKYTVGESLKKETIDLLILIYRVNTRQDKGVVLEEAKERIEVIRLLIRLMKDLHQISIKSFVGINNTVEEVSKQLTGWHKSSPLALVCPQLWCLPSASTYLLLKTNYSVCNAFN